MRVIRLASCAVFLSSVASAQHAERPTTSGSNATTGNSAAAIGSTLGNPAAPIGGAALTPGLGLQPTLNGALPAPNLIAPAAVAPVGAAAVGALPVAPATARPQAGPKALPVRPGAKSVPAAADPAAAAAIPAPDGKGAPSASASSVLDTAARGIGKGREAEAMGSGDGLSIRRALDRTYDAAPGAGDVSGAGGVLARVSNGKAANFTAIADKETMANAPRLYADAIKAVRDALPATASAAERSAAESDVKAILRHARAKSADKEAVSAFVQAVVDAAASGDKGGSARNAAAVEQWTKLYAEMGGRPFFVNDAPLRSLVSRLSGENGRAKAPRVWAEARNGSWLAVIPGAPVEKVPGLAASFALKLEKLAPSPVADAYRAFAARPGLRTAISARVALGDSVPSAVVGTFWSWLKTLAARAWNGLLSLLPGRGLPAVADAATTPRLRAAAASWREATSAGEAAARAAGAPRPTVSRARAAFVLARKAAAAHEALTGESGAAARVESLAASFEAAVKLARLAPSDRLPPALEESLAGDGGLRHWAARYAADARERGLASFSRVRGESRIVALSDGPAALAAPLLAAASKGELRVTAFGDALWASGSGAYGAAKLSADLRPTEGGGSVSLETERGDETLARGLDALGFKVVRAGRGLSARLDAETAQADARDMAALAADGAALMTGGAPLRAPSPEGLERLLADVKSAPGKAEKAAAALDGRSTLSRARTVAWVGELEAVSAEIPSRGERVIALRDPATGLPKYARVEPIRTR